MSKCDKTNQIVLIYSSDNKELNDSMGLTEKQTITNLTKSDRLIKKIDSMDLLLFPSEMEGSSGKNLLPMQRMDVKKEIQYDKILHIPAKDLRGDLSILRVTLTPPGSKIQLVDLNIAPSMETKTSQANFSLLEIINGSEEAAKDRVPWKYLKRSSEYSKENKKFLVSWLRTIHYNYSRILGRRRMNVRCLNCTFYIKSNIRHVSTVRTRRNSCLLTSFGLCGLPYILSLFKDVVHICPLCKVYLGFCPAFKYPVKGDVMTDVITPISRIHFNQIRERVTSTYIETVNMVRKMTKERTNSLICRNGLK